MEKKKATSGDELVIICRKTLPERLPIAEDMGSNLAVVEAKRVGSISTAESHLLCYMGK